MSKKIFLTEEQFQKILVEELGVAKEVNRISRLIESEICKLLEKGEGEYSFSIEGLDVELNYFTFQDNREAMEWLNAHPEIKDGYSYSQNTLYVNVYAIDGKYDIDYLFDTIQHEVEHYWQTKNANKSFVKKSELLTDLLSCGNPVAETIARVVYLSKEYEIDAYVNGSYSVLSKKHFTTFEEYLSNTCLGQIIDILKQCESGVNNWNYETPYVIQGIVMCRNSGIKETTREELLKLIKCTQEYLLRKASRAWALYKTKNVSTLTNEELMERKINDKIFRREIKC